jgi:acyl-CoA reductase-like NAD-dependent aldehyde dehydrogenase
MSVVSTRRAESALLHRHPGIRLRSFTGSVPVGRQIAADLATGFRHVVLELGGNDACIVLPDAHVPEIAAELFARAMVNSGQFCSAIKRIYVSADRQDELVEHLAACAREAAMGDGMDPGVSYGPVTSPAQRDRLAHLVAEAERDGARSISGSSPDLPGHFVPPTVVSGLPQGTRLEAEEQFGPVIPVIGYRDVADAVEAANASEFGLGGSVWGDEETAVELAGRLECGTAWVNTHGALHPLAPFGGFRDSGVGVEYGYWGLLEYTRIRTLNVQRG